MCMAWVRFHSEPWLPFLSPRLTGSFVNDSVTMPQMVRELWNPHALTRHLLLPVQFFWWEVESTLGLLLCALVRIACRLWSNSSQADAWRQLTRKQAPQAIAYPPPPLGPLWFICASYSPSLVVLWTYRVCFAISSVASRACIHFATVEGSGVGLIRHTVSFLRDAWRNGPSFNVLLSPIEMQVVSSLNTLFAHV